MRRMRLQEEYASTGFLVWSILVEHKYPRYFILIVARLWVEPSEDIAFALNYMLLVIESAVKRVS